MAGTLGIHQSAGLRASQTHFGFWCWRREKKNKNHKILMLQKGEHLPTFWVCSTRSDESTCCGKQQKRELEALAASDMKGGSLEHSQAAKRPARDTPPAAAF